MAYFLWLFAGAADIPKGLYMTLDDDLDLQAKQEVLEAAIAQGVFTLPTVLDYIHTVLGGVLDEKYCLNECKLSVSGGQAIVAFGTRPQTEEQLADTKRAEELDARKNCPAISRLSSRGSLTSI